LVEKSRTHPRLLEHAVERRVWNMVSGEVVGGVAMSAVAVLLIGACGSVESSTRDASMERVDASPELRCDPFAPFGTPTMLPGLAGGSWIGPRLLDDELTMFLSGSQTGSTVSDLWVTSRASRQAPFGTPVKLAISSSAQDNFPTVSAHGRAIVFDSDRAGGPRRLWVATRVSTLGEFANPELLSGVGPPIAQSLDLDPFLTADGQELWFASTRSPNQGDIDLWRATRSGSGFSNPVAEQNLSSDMSDGIPVLSHDRLTIYFQSTRSGAGTQGGYDVWRSRRSTVDDGFPAPTPVTELNSAATDWPGWLSPDGCRLYLASDRNGTFAIYLAERQR
jgi:hypothetical protein